MTAFLLAVPYFAPEFWVVQIGTKSLWLAILAMSLVFLAGYGGMLSLAQIALSGTTGYTTAILTVNHGVNGWLAATAGIALGVALGFVLATLAVRTYGIYFLMITLAYGAFAFFFVSQDQALTNGHTGLNGVVPPSIGRVSLSDPTNLYLAALAAATLCYALLHYVIRRPFGLTIQGVRDNPLRMSALGFNVALHRILAFTFAAAIAAIGGAIAVWYNGGISPGSISISQMIDVLIIAVIGGLTRLEGAFVGALVLTLLRNYAVDFTDRYNSLIGAVFVLVVLFSPTGFIGAGERTAQWLRRLLTGERAHAAAEASESVTKGAGVSAASETVSGRPS